MKEGRYSKATEIEKNIYPILRSIQNVQLLHSYHLYWPDLDVDLEIDNLENPQKYPLKSRATKKPPVIHSMGRRIATRQLTRPYYQPRKPSMTENDFLFLIQQKRRFFKEATFSTGSLAP
jgi:hypothetical protein